MSSLQSSILDKNLVVDAGRAEVGERFIAIDPTGTFETAEAMGELLIRSEDSDAQFFLRDVATVSRGYVDPPTRVLRYDGNPSIGIGISTVSGGNVVDMGEALGVRTREILDQLPLGIEFGIISLQSEAVTTAISTSLSACCRRSVS